MAEIVGREAELDVIQRWLAATDRPILVIEGEPGIGKTTLWRAALDGASARGLRILSCSAAQAEATLSFTAIRDLLGESFDEVADELPAPQRHALAVTLLLEEPGASQTEHGAIAVGFLAAIRALAERAPLLVAIDDVHWLDRPSANAVSFLARRLDDDPVALLLSRRTDGPDELPLGLDRVGTERVLRATVGPLSMGATHRLLSSQVGLTLSRPALHRVHQACGGNSLFALEIGRTLRESPVAPVTDDQPLPVPSDVKELFARRIEGLSRPARDAVLAAALQGNPTVTVVDEAAAGDGLEEALRAGVLSADGDRLRFAHPLFAEAATSLTAAHRQREMHLRLASLLAGQEARAQHLALGSAEPDEAIAATLDGAAEAARRGGATASAAALAEHAARLTPRDDVDGVARRTITAALWWTDAGDTRRSLALVEPLIPELPRGKRRLEALYAKARAVEDRVHRTLLEDAVAEAEGHPSEHVRLLFLLCYALLHTQEFDAARERARTAVEVAERTGDASLVVLAFSMAARLEVGRNSVDGLERARELERDALVDAYESPATWLGWWLLVNDELAAARRLLGDQLEKSIDDGDDWNQTFLRWPLTEVECRAGSYDAARAHAEAGLELAEQSENLYALSVLQYCRALVAAHVGDTATARTYAEESLANARATSSVLFTVRPRIALGLLAVSHGRFEDALLHLDGLSGLALEGPYWATYPFWGDLFEALVSLGELDRARRLLADLDLHRLTDERPGTAPVLARCRGLVLAASGSLDEAVASFQEALRLQGTRPVPLERGRTLLVLGEVQRRARLRRAARETLREALTTFESLGAIAWADRAKTEIARIGGRAASSNALTPTEERVAALVAEGKSNKEVAATLVVSVHTVEAALTSIYRKLDVRSRTEMARKLVAESNP